MARIATIFIAGLALGLSAATARAQDTCAGDCDGGESVAINELVTCVNIALGSALVTTCSPCDVNASGDVAINELIAAVNAALNGCTPTTGGFCGDGDVNVDGEECDDGNNIGGDECAANCTDEIRRETNLDPDKSISTLQLGSIKLELRLTGTQALIGGTPRDTAVFGSGGKQLFAAGEFPIVTKAADIGFDPINVTGFACACVRGIEVPEFGPGLSGMGKVACGDQHLQDINFLVEQDHDTTPGSQGNSGSAEGLPDDPECDDKIDAGANSTYDACLEGVGEACDDEFHEHVAVPAQGIPAACNSPRRITFSGGEAPRGSTLLRNKTAIGQLANATTTPCVATRDRDGNCSAPDFGPDCLPCTDDDLEMGTPNLAPTTSGTASVLIYDTGDQSGMKLGAGENCGGVPCIGSVTGEPTDCDALMENPRGPLTGTLVTAFPTIDSTGGDIAVTTTLAAQRPQP